MTKTLVKALLVILEILLFEIQQLTLSYLPKDLMAPLLLSHKTEKHYLALDKNLVVLVYFLKICSFILIPFKFSQVKYFLIT